MKVHLRTLGCRLNQAEIDAMARQLLAGGHEIVAATDAEQIIINTCAVTQDAARSSRQLVRQVHRSSPDAAIHVTGCYAHIEPQAVRALPGVTSVVDNLSKDRLVLHVTGGAVDYDAEPLQRAADSVRAGRTRAFIKVQDGCDNACTFCVTTIARGEGRSRPIQEVVSEIRLLHAQGYQEIVLTGVHLGSYGHDLDARHGLQTLVQTILRETDVPRLRLSSLEPWDLTPDFFSLWQDRRLCPHIHLPLQSGCDATLRRMARRTSQAQFSQLIQEARRHVPDMCITTDIIVGFPGETAAEFAESAAFIEAMEFAGLHVFRYSRRQGTPAARMRQAVPEAEKQARSQRLLAYAEAQEMRYAQQFSGTTREVLWEQVAGATEGGFVNVGYTDNYIRVRSIFPRPLTNALLPSCLGHFDLKTRQMSAEPILD